jgi:nitrate reductase delta subunit
VSVSERQRVLAAVSLVLGYPDPALLAEVPLLSDAVAGLSSPAGPRLRDMIAHLERTPPAALAAEYVDTFDLRRRCCLYLTYYTYGDTRQRGVALLRFAHEYRSAGLEPPHGELPDHLAVVCNFAALAPEPGVRLLVEHQPAIELLRSTLEEAGSPYLDALDALAAVLPRPTASDLQCALDLARHGPPAEAVGLEPFAPPEYMGSQHTGGKYPGGRYTGDQRR